MAKDFLLHRISYEKKREEVYRWAHGLFGCFCLAAIAIRITEVVREAVAVTVMNEVEVVIEIVAVITTIPDLSHVLIPDHSAIEKPVAVKTKTKGKGIFWDALLL